MLVLVPCSLVFRPWSCGCWSSVVWMLLLLLLLLLIIVLRCTIMHLARSEDGVVQTPSFRNDQAVRGAENARETARGWCDMSFATVIVTVIGIMMRSSCCDRMAHPGSVDALIIAVIITIVVVVITLVGVTLKWLP
jgi:hypothetical protein